MEKNVGAILIVLLATSIPSFGRSEETLQQLIARAEAAPPAHQPDLYVEVAERELKSTVESYKANQPEEGRVALEQIVTYTDKAHAAPIHPGKRNKHTQIKNR